MKKRQLIRTISYCLASMCVLAIVTMIIAYIDANPNLTEELAKWEQERLTQPTVLKFQLTQRNRLSLSKYQMSTLRENKAVSQISQTRKSVQNSHPETLSQKQHTQGKLLEYDKLHAENTIVSEQETHNGSPLSQGSQEPKQNTHTESSMHTSLSPQLIGSTVSRQEQERHNKSTRHEDKQKQQSRGKMPPQEQDKNDQLTVQELLPTISGGNTVPMSQEDKVGYFLALDFSDQGTGSYINIISFLCFASELGGVRVVEPFLVGSVFGQFVHATEAEETKFSDVFDYDVFKSFVLSKNYSPPVSYDTFLKNAPRKLLLAQYQCFGERCKSCGHEDVLEKGRMFSEMNGFEMVGHVCLKYRHNWTLTYTEIEQQLYATYNRSEVVVLFVRFGGIQAGRFNGKGGYTLLMSPTSCDRKQYFALSKIRPSQLVITSADNYIYKYLKDKQYISVMVRIEKIYRTKPHIKRNFTDIAPALTKSCVRFLLRKLAFLKKKHAISATFLCLDVGDYGSTMFRDEQYLTPILPYFDNLVSQTISHGMTLSEWDKTFGTVALRQDPGFIAVMQKVIAARGKVLVLMGGASTFQASTKEMYNSLHPEYYKRLYDYGQTCIHKMI